MQEVGLLPYVFPEIARLAGFTGATVVSPRGESAAAISAPDIFTRTIRRLDAIQQQEAIMHSRHLDLLLAALLQNSGLPEAAQLSYQALAEHSAGLALQRLNALRMTTIGAHVDRIVTLITHSTLELNTLNTAARLRHLAHRLGLDATLMLFDLWLADRLGNLPPHPIDDLLACRQRLQDEIARHVPLSLQDLAVNGHDVQRLGMAPGPRLGQLLQTLLQHVLDDPTQNTRDHLLAMAQSEVNAVRHAEGGG
jgi:hypothetical protein